MSAAIERGRADSRSRHPTTNDDGLSTLLDVPQPNTHESAKAAVGEGEQNDRHATHMVRRQRNPFNAGRRRARRGTPGFHGPPMIQ